MEIQEILSHCDHTQLSVTAGWEEIRALCDEGVAYRTASVCIPPRYVKRARDYLKGRLKICTVVGFPNGYAAAAVKVFETEQAVRDGADEIDMVIPIGALKEKEDEEVLREIREVKKASCGRILKVIVETCLLTEEEKIRACRLVTEAGADYIKTSTGFSRHGATREDVALLCRHAGENVRVKAAGGIASFRDAEDFLALGADRLGTSRLVKEARAASCFSPEEKPSSSEPELYTEKG